MNCIVCILWEKKIKNQTLHKIRCLIRPEWQHNIKALNAR